MYKVEDNMVRRDNAQWCVISNRTVLPEGETTTTTDEKNKEHNFLPCLLLRDGEMMARGCLSISLLEDGGSTYDVERASFVRLGVAY